MRHLLLLLLVSVPTLIFSQSAKKQKLLERYIIQKSSMNGKDITSLDVQRGGSLIFVDIDNELYFGNGGKKVDNQSFGPVTNYSKQTLTGKKNKTELITYKWKFHNNYNNQNGVADIKLKRVYKTDSVIFNAVMTFDGNEVVYHGYMEKNPKRRN